MPHIAAYSSCSLTLVTPSTECSTSAHRRKHARIEKIAGEKGHTAVAQLLINAKVVLKEEFVNLFLSGDQEVKG
jgi:hypothetical protein